MGNLLSFHPKIHSLRTHSKKFRGLFHAHRRLDALLRQLGPMGTGDDGELRVLAGAGTAKRSRSSELVKVSECRLAVEGAVPVEGRPLNVPLNAAPLWSWPSKSEP